MLAEAAPRVINKPGGGKCGKARLRGQVDYPSPQSQSVAQGACESRGLLACRVRVACCWCPASCCRETRREGQMDWGTGDDLRQGQSIA